MFTEGVTPNAIRIQGGFTNTMAKQNLTVTFKNCQIDLENGELVEFNKEDTKTYRLMDELRKFAGDDKLVDITIKESSELPDIEE